MHRILRQLFTLSLLLTAAARAADVQIAPDGMLTVDGQRTFVVGLYENPDDDQVLQDVADAGFNLVRASGESEALDRLQRHHLYGWVNTGGRIKLAEDSEAAAVPLHEMAAALASHPALLVWEVPDEILWNCMLHAFRGPATILEKAAAFDANARALAPQLHAGYAALRRLDPYHPIWMNHAAGNSIEHLNLFGRAADIIGCDIYPLMPYPTAPFDISRSGLALVGMCATRMQASAPDNPVWMVLQGVGWGDFEGIFTLQPRPSQRPTLLESRFMAYDAIARGARGVLYWGTHIIPKDTSFWRDLLAVTRELADRQALLSAPDSTLVPKIETRLFGLLPYKSPGAAIDLQALGKNIQGKTWWIVVNEFFFPVTYAMRGLESLEGTTYLLDSDNASPLVVRNGELTGRLPRYGVHILRPAS